MYQRPPKHISYGTAGFRDKADQLDVVLYRIGHIAAMRSRYLQKTVGVMITASHNPPADNGAKIIDPNGDMLEESWESRVEALANCQTHGEFSVAIEQNYKELKLSFETEAHVVYGRDTRESGEHLAEILAQGIASAKSKHTDYSCLTTPQLHYIVRALNFPSFGEPTVKGYFLKTAEAMKQLLNSTLPTPKLKIVVDCANGVGALKLLEMVPYIDSMVDITFVNCDYSNPASLNVECGADYVKTGQKLPNNVKAEAYQLCCSFDGDADRVVFYYVDSMDKFCLLDGDRIATLAAKFFKRFQTSEDGSIGVVQTAYANGSSTEYIKNVLDLKVECTPTGVKHLHHVAQQFGIGIYFEANGHGTVLFNEKNIKQSPSLDHKSLLEWSHLINQTVGDAISDMFMVLVILDTLNMSCQDWYAEYSDLPNRLMKTSVANRLSFKTTDAERRLVEPKDVQKVIDEQVESTNKGRCFVRASGTEDVVRVYAEAKSQEACDLLAKTVCDYISSNYNK